MPKTTKILKLVSEDRPTVPLEMALPPKLWYVVVWNFILRAIILAMTFGAGWFVAEVVTCG